MDHGTQIPHHDSKNEKMNEINSKGSKEIFNLANICTTVVDPTSPPIAIEGAEDHGR